MTLPSHLRRRPRRATTGLVGACLLLAALAVTGGWASAVSGQPADPRMELHDRMNHERRRSGLVLLRAAGDLQTIAQRHTDEMVRTKRLQHNPRLGQQMTGYVRFGENIGNAASAHEVHTIFMRSDHHRTNILDPGFAEVGIGVAWSGRTLWVTQVFRQPIVAYAVPPPPRAASSPPPAPPPSVPLPMAAPPPPPAPPEPAGPPVTTPSPVVSMPVPETIPPPPLPSPPAGDGTRLAATLASGHTGRRELHPLVSTSLLMAACLSLTVGSRKALRRSAAG